MSARSRAAVDIWSYTQRNFRLIIFIWLVRARYGRKGENEENVEEKEEEEEETRRRIEFWDGRR